TARSTFCSQVSVLTLLLFHRYPIWCISPTLLLPSPDGLNSEAVYPGGVGVHISFKESASIIVDKNSLFIKECMGASYIPLRLLHHGYIEEYHRLTQDVVGSEPSDRAYRYT